MAQRVAFLIGNQTFRPDSDLTPLQGPQNDIAALAPLLRDPERGNFEVHEFLDKPRQEIMHDIAEGLDSATSGDLLLIYYSGHGMLDRGGRLCLATADTRRGDALMVASSIPARHLSDLVEASDCDQVLLLLDCCFSGAVKGMRGDVGSALAVVEEAHGFSIITATTSLQTTREEALTPGSVVMGKFTAALVDGIESGAADQGRKGKILLSDLRHYLGRAVTSSTPQFFDRRASGDPLISLSPATAAPVLGEHIRPLVEMLEHPMINLRRGAAQALMMGPSAAAAVPALTAALKDPDDDVRWHAAAALGTIGPSAAEAVPALAAALKDPHEFVRGTAAQSLGMIGPYAADAARALVATLEDPNKDVRQRAAAALGKIGPNAAGTVPALAATLKDPNEDVRQHAAYALGKIGPNAADAVPALVATLKDPHEGVRWNAAVALGYIGPNAAEAVPALVATLKDPNETVRHCAATALGGIGLNAAEAVPALAAALKDPDKDVRKRAGVALERLQNKGMRQSRP